MTSYLIVDDEPIAHRIIEGYCEELPYFKKIGNAYNVFEASQIISTNKVDLIFLDINMPKMTGFEWLKTISKPPKIIVTSAYREYALEGYELDVIDYLLKPFSLVRFVKAINKLNEEKTSYISESLISKDMNQSFFLKGDKQHHQIRINTILFIEAIGNYTKVYFNDEMVVSHEKISNMEKMLSNFKFLRVHKSFLVSIDKINSVKGNQIHLQNHKIPIGQTYKSRIIELLDSK
jgi:DNA-binding LytR/AlgR family response regulator